jgi:hypothetical protein
MSQSSAIFFFIAAAFLVFITQRGELRSYLGFLYGTDAPTNAPANSGAGPLGSLGNTNTPGSPATSFSNWLTGALGLPSWLLLN